MNRRSLFFFSTIYSQQYLTVLDLIRSVHIKLIIKDDITVDRIVRIKIGRNKGESDLWTVGFIQIHVITVHPDPDGQFVRRCKGQRAVIHHGIDIRLPYRFSDFFAGHLILCCAADIQPKFMNRSIGLTDKCIGDLIRASSVEVNRFGIHGFSVHIKHRLIWSILSGKLGVIDEIALIGRSYWFRCRNNDLLSRQLNGSAPIGTDNVESLTIRSCVNADRTFVLVSRYGQFINSPTTITHSYFLCQPFGITIPCCVPAVDLHKRKVGPAVFGVGTEQFKRQSLVSQISKPLIGDIDRNQFPCLPAGIHRRLNGEINSRRKFRNCTGQLDFIAPIYGECLA